MEFNRPFWLGVLAAQNVLAVIPTIVILAGLVGLAFCAFAGPRGAPGARFVPIAFLILAGSLLFLYFVVSVPSWKTSNVKATYLCYLMPGFAMGGAWMLRRILDRPSGRFFWVAFYCLAFWLWSFCMTCVYYHHE